MIAFLILAACCTNRHVSPDIRQVSAGTAETAHDSGARMIITDLGGDMIPDGAKIASDTGRDMHNILHLAHSIRSYQAYRTAAWRDTAAPQYIVVDSMEQSDDFPSHTLGDSMGVHEVAHGEAARGFTRGDDASWDSLLKVTNGDPIKIYRQAYPELSNSIIPERDQLPPSYPQPFGDSGNRLFKEQVQAMALFARIDSLESRIKALESRPTIEIREVPGHPNRIVWLDGPRGEYSIRLKEFDYSMPWIDTSWRTSEAHPGKVVRITAAQADSTAYNYPEVRKNIGEVTTEKAPQ